MGSHFLNRLQFPDLVFGAHTNATARTLAYAHTHALKPSHRPTYIYKPPLKKHRRRHPLPRDGVRPGHAAGGGGGHGVPHHAPGDD
jgi:hypothetical protein